jgi:RimJ/RimL family protein N-acetyltransferase
LLLPFARRHGLKTIWITCNPNNWPSRRTCERLGATLVEIVPLPPDNDQYIAGEREKCRYRIELEPQIEIVELTSRIADADVAAVWSLAAPDPADMEHRRKVLALYPPAGTRRMFGVSADGILCSTCGVTQHAERRITVHQMATIPTHRRRGFARRLLAAVIEQLNPRILECGTDAPNDIFYRACGFETISEGIPPSGIERFHCRLVRD